MYTVYTYKCMVLANPMHESWWQGQLELQLGWEGGRDGKRAISSLFGRPPNFISGNPGQPLKINI